MYLHCTVYSTKNSKLFKLHGYSNNDRKQFILCNWLIYKSDCARADNKKLTCRLQGASADL